MKRLMILAILAVLASSSGCNFCKRFCGSPAPVQPVMQPMYQACPPVVNACDPCSTGTMAPMPTQ